MYICERFYTGMASNTMSSLLLSFLLLICYGISFYKMIYVLVNLFILPIRLGLNQIDTLFPWIIKSRLGNFTMMSQPIDSGKLVACLYGIVLFVFYWVKIRLCCENQLISWSGTTLKNA